MFHYSSVLSRVISHSTDELPSLLLTFLFGKAYPIAVEPNLR
jgi:hypothetical protein